MISKIISIAAIFMIATMAIELAVNLKNTDMAVIVIIFAIIAIGKCLEDLFKNDKNWY